MRGSIRRRSAGSWTLIYDLPPKDDGKRRQRRETVRCTKPQAEKLLAQRLEGVNGGRYNDGARLTFNELADRYLSASAGRIEATSLAWYTRVLAQHVRPAFGHMRLEAIRPLDVQSMLDNARNVSRTKAKGSPLGSSTRRNVLIGTRAVFNWACKMGLMSRNPAALVEPPKVEPREYPDFSLSVVTLFLEAVAGTDFEILAPFAIWTGLRRQELCALRWSDVDLDLEKYSVRRAAGVLDGKVYIKSPKSSKSRRTEGLPPYIVELLRGHRTTQAKRYDRLGLPIAGPDALVFARPNGAMWHPNELSKRWSRFIRKLGLPRARLHDLRHAFATLSHDSGESLHTISAAMGHSSLAITSKTYVHLFDEQKRDRARRLDAYLESAVVPLDAKRDTANRRTAKKS